jgi:aspartokinase
VIKISSALQELIQKNNFLEFGLSEGLLNLTATAHWLKPLLEARTKKTVSHSAILMALSRQVTQKKKIKPGLQRFQLDGITVKAGLTEFTYPSSTGNRKNILEFMKNLQGKVPHITSNFGTREITIILPSSNSAQLKSEIREKPKFEKTGLAALCIEFRPEYVLDPYLLYYLIQQITLQNINIWEISSTYTEIIFYLEEKDIKLAFDTIYLQFTKS